MRVRYMAMGGLLLAAVLGGCATTDRTILLDPAGEPITVTPEEIEELSGREQPYLVQVGDEIDLAFFIRDYHRDKAPWNYRIEVGDRMEVRLNQDTDTRLDYRLDVGDLVGIAFLNNWELNVTRTVRPDGKITFDHVGEIQAAGLTARELEARLDAMYRETELIQGDPYLTVTVDFSNPDRLENISRDVMVRPDGKIRLPGIKEDVHVAGLTVDEACAAVQRKASEVLQNPPVVSMMVFPFINDALAAMNRRVLVRPDGTVTVPRIGQIQVAGYSVDEIERNLAEACEGVIHNPVEPSVEVTRATGGRIYVGGEVGMPDVYPLEAAPSALQAIIMAGGTTDRSRLNSVLVIRRNPDGRPFVFKTNLNLAFKGHTENDILLRPFDVVYVPKKMVSRANLFVQQYINDIVPFDNSLGVTGTYYLNEQRVRSRSRNVNFSTGFNVVPSLSGN